MYLVKNFSNGALKIKETRENKETDCVRTVKCLINVEAFVLRAKDLEEVITLFDGFVKNHPLQFSIRKKSPYWQGVVETSIQFFEDIFPYVDMQDIANNEDDTMAERSPSYHDILIDDEQPTHVKQGHEQQAPNSSAPPDLAPDPQPDSAPQMG
ncbi:unnamed protein product [Lactuca saligna]|uniref:Uncharacterized protein n=1 Tax=Lactuca saligna TaxID=75948 RepID=A0AA35VQA8_LACSI|nr:unnamed protein product [Lactuca saligna]